MYTPVTIATKRAGFTLTEVMSSVAILSLVMMAASMTYTTSLRSWRRNTARMDASSSASQALTRCTMGVGTNFGLRAAFIPVLINSDNDGWVIRFTTPAGDAGDETTDSSLVYNADARTITFQNENNPPTIIGDNIINSTVSRQSDAIMLTVRAQASKGYTNITSQMSTAIAPRNRSS
jgi:prepilin-type N-terminal cleavage/methylation domain-containing protein